MTLRVASRRIVNYNGRAITAVTTWFRKSNHGQRSRERKLPRVCASLYMRTAYVLQSTRALLRKHETFGYRFITSHQLLERLCRNYLSIALMKRWKKCFHGRPLGVGIDYDRDESDSVYEILFFWPLVLSCDYASTITESRLEYKYITWVTN